MFISKLKINNFKHISEAEFEFGKINLISGETGEGKTSVIEALTFLLTNTLQDRIEEYIRWGQKKFVISEEFTHKSISYNYEIIAGKTTDRQLTVSSGGIHSKVNHFLKSDATKELSLIIDPDLTLYSNISMQHKSTELLFEKPAPRLQKIKPIFKVDAINEKVDLIKTDIKELQDKISTIQTEITTLQGVTYEYMDVPSLPEVDITQLEDSLKIFEEKKLLFEKELKQYEVYKEQLKVYEAAIQEIEKNTNLLRLNERKTSSLIRTIEEIPDFDQKRYDECQTITKNNTLELLMLRNEIEAYNKIQKDIKDLSSKIEEREELIKQNRLKRLPRISLTEEEIIAKKKTLQDVHTSFSKQSDKVTAILEGKCPTCGSEFSSTEIEVEKEFKEGLRQRKDSLEEELNNVEKQIKERNTIESDNKIIQSRIDIWNKDITEATEKIETLKTIKKPNEDKVIALQKEYDTISEELEKLGKLKQLVSEIIERNKEKQEDLKNLETDKTVLATKIEELLKISRPQDFIFKSDYDDLAHKEVHLLVMEYKVKEAEIAKIEEMNTLIKKREKETIKKIGELERTLFDLRGEVGVLKETATIMDKDFSSYLVDLGSAFIKSKMNSFFQRGYGKYSIDLKQDGRGIEFFYSENGGDWHSISMLSGFEQQIFGVAFRVALTKMQDLNFMLLDEIDSDASPMASLKLYKTVLAEGFEQLFVITHAPETKEFFGTLPECKVFEIKNGQVEK